ncbi:PrgI family protein [bacterium 210702-DFI.5.13]|nr:PrgI family protein [bacterium 210702-DFI.5.13]
MIETQVPKDVSVYEAPLIGPLTSRQAICVAAAAAVEYIYYTIVNTIGLNLDTNTLICIGMVLAAPIIYMAVGKPYGMRAETYIYNYLLPSMVAPKNRVYETTIIYDVMYDELLKKYEEEQLKNGIKPKNTQNVKKKKTKRARSKQDIMYA